MIGLAQADEDCAEATEDILFTEEERGELGAGDDGREEDFGELGEDEDREEDTVEELEVDEGREEERGELVEDEKDIDTELEVVGHRVQI